VKESFHEIKEVNELNNIEGQDIIKFYRTTGDYGFLSNLYKKSIIFEGREFPTSEHAYQFGKFKDEITREWAMNAPKPHLLSILSHGLFSWEEIANNLDMDKPITFEVYRALQKHYLNNYLKVKKRIERK